jgi:hypothetical protein
MDRAMPLTSGGRRLFLFLAALAAAGGIAVFAPAVRAQETDDSYHPPQQQQGERTWSQDAYKGGRTGSDQPPADGATVDPNAPYRPGGGAYNEGDNYRRYEDDRSAATGPRDERGGAGYGEPYHAPGEGYDGPTGGPPPREDGYSQNEIIAAGGRFFGSVSKGLANVVEYSFRKSGRPNGYILGEDAGGAFVAGLRYGEGTLYTKDAGTHRVFWQGPSIGYDFGGEGSKTMVLVYNLRDPAEIYERYAGVQGSAYLVGGVGIQYQTHGSVTLAPIRSGIGLRLGANVGYLKYTRSPTWNPF